MFKLDNAFLEELGLGTLPAVEKNKMLAHIYETLEMRVGMRLAEQMSNEQLDEFEGYINRQDESGALKWLETNFPDYKQVVAEELEKLKGEIKQVAPQIVAQSQSATQQPQQQTPPQQPQPNQQGQPMQPPTPAQPQQMPPVQPQQQMPPQQPQQQNYQQPYQPYQDPNFTQPNQQGQPMQPPTPPQPQQMPPVQPQQQTPPQQPWQPGQ